MRQFWHFVGTVAPGPGRAATGIPGRYLDDHAARRDACLYAFVSRQFERQAFASMYCGQKHASYKITGMQSSPVPGGSAWWQQLSQPQTQAAPARAGPPTGVPTAPPLTARPWWERASGPLGPPATSWPGAAPPSGPIGAATAGPLDVRTLLHPSESSRLALALTVSLLVFTVVAIGLVADGGSTILFEFILLLLALGGMIWLSRLLGGAVRVSDSSLPELQAVFDEVRARLNYHEDIDVYVMAKVTGGSAMTSYLGTRIIQIEGGLVAELLEEGQHAELTFLIGRHIGQLKAKHERLQWILIVISLVDSLKFLQLFLAPYFRATAKSGDQIAAACCGDIRATAWMMNRLLVGKELGPRLDIRGVLDQAVTVRSGLLPRLAQMFQNVPHATNRYLNLLAFFARTAPDEVNAWRASLDPATASRLAAVLDTSRGRQW
jgi:hypothetical protein